MVGLGCHDMAYRSARAYFKYAVYRREGTGMEQTDKDGRRETMERTYTLMLVEDRRNILYGMKNAILCHNAPGF